jgi:TRAP transporter TAXI family solute receptor
MMMTTRRGLMAGAAALSIARPASANETLRIGAMPVGSGWYVAAAAIQRVVAPVLEGHTVEIIPRGGGVANPMVVEGGTAQIALSNVQTAVLAANGDPLYNGRKAENIRALVGGLNPVYMGAMVRNGFLRQNNFTTLDQVLDSGKPLRIVMKPQGSNVPPAVDTILAAHGLSRDKVRANGGSITQVDVAQIPAILRDGRADILFDTVLRGHPMITELALTADIRFLDLSERSLEALARVGLRRAMLPQWFQGQDGETRSGDFGTVLIAHASVADDVAYRVVKAIIENRDRLVSEYPAFNAFKAEDAWKPENTGVPLHPGAARYYRERGWMS